MRSVSAFYFFFYTEIKYSIETFPVLFRFFGGKNKVSLIDRYDNV